MNSWTIPALLLAWVLMAAPVPLHAQDDWGDEETASKVEFHGFIEAAAGSRVVDNPVQSSDFLLGESRFRLEVGHEGDIAGASFKGDFVADAVRSSIGIDIRDASVYLQPADWIDLRAGRQVLTWGTGDFVFLNDMFPKDFQSFFAGRADEFLKRPSTAFKVSLFPGNAIVDLVWTPIFEPDQIITGRRLSYFSPQLGDIAGESMIVSPVRPTKTLTHGEFSGRVAGTIQGYELAAYGYQGFNKQPSGFDPVAVAPVYPRLSVYGASVRGALLGGVLHGEFAFHHSYKDDSGLNPLIPNSHTRQVVGYEHELFKNMTLGMQYYSEYTLQHSNLIASSPTPQFETDELRHLLTARLRWSGLQDTLTASLFTFIGISDRDAHLRPSLSYQINDQVSVALGSNIMLGQDSHTFFGQLENDSNVYARLRYSF